MDTSLKSRRHLVRHSEVNPEPGSAAIYWPLALPLKITQESERAIGHLAKIRQFVFAEQTGVMITEALSRLAITTTTLGSLARQPEVSEPAAMSLLPPRRVPSPISRDEEITELYEEFADLRKREGKLATADPDLEREVRTAFARLRELQLEEAREFRAAAEARLLMPISAGQDVLAKVNRLLEGDEDSAG